MKPQLIKSESCGCKDQGIILSSKHNLKGYKFYESKMDVINEIDKILKDKPVTGSEIYDTFMGDAKNRNKGAFMKKLDLFLRESMENDEDLGKWFDVLSVLRIAAKRSILTPWQKNKAESIFNSAMYYTSNVSSRYQENIKINTVNRINNERSFGLKLISNFNMENILNLLARELPSFGIKECYIALYDNPAMYNFPDPCPEWSRLVLAYNEKERMPLGDSGMKFKTREIIPANIMKNDTVKNYIVNALFFNDIQIGYTVFDASDPSGTIYRTLSNQISNSLQGTLLIDRINSHTEILETGIKSLSESVEVMTENIESINSNILKQSAAVEESAGSIEEMKSNITNIADVSKRAADISNNLDTVAVESIDSIRNTIISIKDIQTKSANIIEIINLLQEISNKTKLLAFNASIEAAHASENGKGFNVVSHEIRKLSENTDSSLRKIGIEINHLINSINQATNVSEIIESNLDKIIGNSRINSDISNQINVAMQEQNKGSEEILNAIMELVKITSEIKSSIKEQVRIAEEFNVAIKKLKGNI